MTECVTCGQRGDLRGLYVVADANGNAIRIEYSVCSRECAERFVSEMRRANPAQPVSPVWSLSD